MNDLEALDAQHRGNASLCWNAVMEDWLNEEDEGEYPATWEGLYRLLSDVGFSNVACSLQEAVAGL